MSARDPFDAFGRLVADPAELTHAQRVDVARRLAGRLLGSSDAGERWLGANLREWLIAGGDLARLLGLRLAGGGHLTPQRIIRAENVDRLIARTVCAIGSQARAARILAGIEPAPVAVAALVLELHALGAPCSRRSIAESMRRTRRRVCTA